MPFRKDRIKKLVAFSKKEWETVEENARKTGCRYVGTYIRRMAIHGTIKIYDMKIVQDVRMEMRRIGTNVNQIAHMANSTQSVSIRDIEMLKIQIKALSDVMEKWLKPLD